MINKFSKLVNILKMFGKIKISNIDDYILPSNECVKPLKSIKKPLIQNTLNDSDKTKITL